MMKHHYRLAIVCLLAMVLAGCETYDAYTGDKKLNKATTIGVASAALCGLIGSRDSGKKARKNAFICGSIGAGIGAYMDQQEKQLRNELIHSGVQVKRNGDDIQLIMPNNITFDTNQSLLKPSAYSPLNAVVTVMNKFDQTRLEISGHTDSSGQASYNQTLSEKRAHSVAAYLRSQKLSPARVFTVGYGENRPVDTNQTAAGRANNRRVELLIQPLAQ